MTDVATQVVSCARGWVGTGFAHQGRRKASQTDKGGVDCLGLLVGVALECGLRRHGRLLGSHDETNYGHIPDGNRLKGALEQYLQPVPTDGLQAGDVVLMLIDGNPQHLGIVADYARGGYSLIHAYAPARGVVEHRLDASWKRRIVSAYRFDATVT